MDGSCGDKKSELPNSPDFKDLENSSDGSFHLGALLGTLFAFVLAEASAVFHYQQVLKHGRKQNSRLLLPFLLCCSTGYKTQAKEESKMKLKVVSKPFDGYMSPAAKSGGGSSGCCCCCVIIFLAP